MILREPAIERADKFAVQKDLRVIVQFVENKIAFDGTVELLAVKNVPVSLVEIFHAQHLFGVDGRGQHVPKRDGFLASLNSGIFVAGATVGTAGGVMPVALAMTSRKLKYFGVGRPLSSSGAS